MAKKARRVNPIHVRLTDAELSALRSLANQQSRTPSDMIRVLLLRATGLAS